MMALKGQLLKVESYFLLFLQNIKFEAICNIITAIRNKPRINKRLSASIPKQEYPAADDARPAAVGKLFLEQI